MRLADLDAHFLAVTVPGREHRRVDRIAEADGVAFLCPKCFAARGGAEGTHLVVCWSPRVAPEERPGPGRWDLVGTSLDDLSLVAGSSSVQLTSGCRAHFFVERGAVRTA